MFSMMHRCATQYVASKSKMGYEGAPATARMPTRLHISREIYLRFGSIDMFKFIGATVVYGFALFGLCTYLSSVNNLTDSQ